MKRKLLKRKVRLAGALYMVNDNRIVRIVSLKVLAVAAAPQR